MPWNWRKASPYFSFNSCFACARFSAAWENFRASSAFTFGRIIASVFLIAVSICSCIGFYLRIV
jgi:hypothetical protein